MGKTKVDIRAFKGKSYFNIFACLQIKNGSSKNRKQSHL